MRFWPALDIQSADDILLATLDDFHPTALEELERGLRAYFATAQWRDAARAALEAQGIAATAADVPDENWAARSQQDLRPVTVGRITIVADPAFPIPAPRSLIPATPHSPRPAPFTMVIRPSMGFGTGHHATTRLCLAALQELSLEGAAVLDVGTGSGILAIAAALLGAVNVSAIDHDADAVQSAGDNLVLNPGADRVTFSVADLADTRLPESDVVTANLTGAMLTRSAAPLLAGVRSGGTLIASGILAPEEDGVRRAFSAASLVDRRQEDEWVCLILKKP